MEDQQFIPTQTQIEETPKKFWTLETFLFLVVTALIVGSVLFLSTQVISNVSQSKAVKTEPIDKFINNYIDISSWQMTLEGQRNPFYKFWYVATDPNRWQVTFAHNLKDNYIRMHLDWAFANRTSFPRESQFYPNDNFNRVAVEQFFRGRGVKDQIFFSKLREDFNEEYHQGNYLGDTSSVPPGDLDIRGIWRFTPTTENNGLTKLIFLASSIGHFPGQDTNVATSIEWQFEPSFIPGNVSQTIAKIEAEGVQKGLATEKTIQTFRFFSTLTFLAPIYYLTLPLNFDSPRGVMSNFHGGKSWLTQVFIFQLVLLIIQLGFAFFLLRFILKRYKTLRFGIFWLFIGIIVSLLFYMGTEFVLVSWVLSNH